MLLIGTFLFLAIVLFYTRKDWTLKPQTLLQWYLLFTVAFYFYRWTFQLGAVETTLYENDAPFLLRIIKDLAYLGLLCAYVVKSKFRRSPLLWYVLPFAVWVTLASFVRLSVVNDARDSFFHWRGSLQYIPLAFFVLEEDLRQIIRFAVGCCWIVVGFLALEAFSGRTSGFFKGGLFSRFGSIFGSPNELGLFTVLALLGVLMFSEYVPRTTKIFLVPALWVTLALSASRSAILGLVAGLVALWPKSRYWLVAIGVAGLAGYFSVVTVLKQAPIIDELVERVADVSAASRIDELEFVKSEILSWSVGNFAFGDFARTAQENYYFSILMRSGFVGILLFSVFAFMTLKRVRHPFLRGGIVSVLVASCFVPYLDLFPVNVYFWLMVGVGWSTLEYRSPVRYTLLDSALRGAERART